jgi:hypothetical protein
MWETPVHEKGGRGTNSKDNYIRIREAAMRANRLAIAMCCLLVGTLIAEARPLREPRYTQPARTERQKSANPKTEEKEREAALEAKAFALVDQVLKDAQGLRLRENLVRIQATGGDLLWNRDQKRARSLFKQAIDGLVEIQRSIDSSTAAASDPALMDYRAAIQEPLLNQMRFQLRQEVLTIVARHDARLALEFLRSTRRTSTAGTGTATQAAFADRYLEFNLASQIADSDPKEALRIAEDSLEHGVSYELTNLVSRLAASDKESAGKLASEIIDKLRSADLSKSDMQTSVALNLLKVIVANRGASNETSDVSTDSVFDQNIARDLMGMLASAALKVNPNPESESSDDDDDEDDEVNGSGLLRALGGMLPDVQRLAPDRFDALKTRLDQITSSASPAARAQEEYQRLLATGTADQLIDAAQKGPAEQKPALYERAVAKALEAGDVDRARQIATELVPDPNRQRILLTAISQQALNRFAAIGKLNEARPMLDRMNPGQRANSLVGFANFFAGKGDKKTALQLLEEAESLIGSPTNFTEVQTQIGIATTYAALDPVAGFQVLELLIDQMNGLVSALQLIDGFEYGRHFVDGEIANQNASQVIRQSFQCARLLSSLSRKDFERSKACAERFQPIELRLSALLAVARGVLASPELPDPRPGFIELPRQY